MITLSLTDNTFVGRLKQTIVASGGTWLPTSESSLQGWFDASVNTNLLNLSIVPPADGDQITFCNDSSTFARTITGAGSPNPIWKANIQNGLGVIRFLGSNEYFFNTSLATAFAVNDGPIIMATVLRFFDTGTGKTFISFYGSEQMNFGKVSNDTYYYQRYDGSTVKSDVAGTTDTSWHTWITVCTGTTATMYVDGTLIGSANIDVDVNTMADLTVFGIGRTGGGGGNMYGDVGELMLFNNSSVSVSNIQNYLKNKWGTP